jgi:hypothetical protein
MDKKSMMKKAVMGMKKCDDCGKIKKNCSCEEKDGMGGKGMKKYKNVRKKC